MIVYSGTKRCFMHDMENDRVPELIDAVLKQKMHVTAGAPQRAAWNNSLNAMFKALSTSKIPGTAGVAIEYNIPMTSKRVDFMISGYDASNTANVVVIELKQWEKLKAIPGDNPVVETFLGGKERMTVHPSYQAWSYAALIEDYNATVQDAKIRISPCAFLHNYHRASKGDPLDAEQYREYLEDAPAFVAGEVPRLRRFITSRIVSGDDTNVLESIEHGRIRPSKKLQDCVISMLEGNPEFVLIDEQETAFACIMQWSEKCRKDGKKRTIIVEGGPGTGKSVVALNLLAKLTAQGQLVQYVTKTTAPREVYLSKLTGGSKSSVSNLFRGSGTFVGAEPGSIDTLLVDEAHRLNARSGIFRNYGENQVKEIIEASKCSVFFLDESQRVTIEDIGSRHEIEKWAEAAGSEVHHMCLPSQFRCNGSDGYLAWLDNTLQIRRTANYTLEGSDYDFRVVDSPQELRRLIEEKNKEAGPSRVVAGYCWEWPRDSKPDPECADIVIGDFRMSWNLSTTQTYAIDETSIHEAGCVHTVQGLEFSYVGVIIGDDMRFEDGEIVTDFAKRAKTDRSLRGIKKLNKENPEEARRIADEVIKNTYRTLMTRGLKGCFVYCTDRALADYLRENAY